MTESRPEFPRSEIAGPGHEAPVAQNRRGFSFRGPRPSAARARPVCLLGLVVGTIYAAMTPHVNAQSSRATAVTAICDGFPRLTMRVYFRCSRN